MRIDPEEGQALFLASAAGVDAGFEDDPLEVPSGFEAPDPADADAVSLPPLAAPASEPPSFVPAVVGSDDPSEEPAGERELVA